MPAASAIDPHYGPSERLSGPELERAGGGRIPLAARSPGPSKGSLEVKYYIGAEFETVIPRDSQLFEVRCPVRGQEPVTGGSFTPSSGLVISNSSRTSPVPTFPTHARSWYEAVTNLTGAELRWKPFVTCVQG